MVAEKSGSMLFWPKNLFCNPFGPKTPIKHHKTKTNPFMALKNPKNHLKNQTQPKTKNQPELISVFSWTFKVQKHLIWTSRIKWNNLTQKTKTNPFMALKNPKNQTKPKTKNQPEFRYVFSWTFKVQRHLIWTSRIKWNNLTQKNPFLMS
jgi:hypothetical protein